MAALREPPHHYHAKDETLIPPWTTPLVRPRYLPTSGAFFAISRTGTGDAADTKEGTAAKHEAAALQQHRLAVRGGNTIKACWPDRSDDIDDPIPARPRRRSGRARDPSRRSNFQG
jgi:hypothetical protein